MCIKCQEILLPLSKSEKWEDAQLEWIPGLADRVTNCICGTPIKHQCPIQNIKTKHIVVLGSICIITHKTFEHNHKLVEHVKDGLKYYCKCCDKKVTNKESHIQSVRHILLEDEYEIKKTFNKCMHCKTYRIKKPDTYKYCWTCQTLKYRKCTKCFKNNIKRSSTYKLCYSCNQLK